MLNLNAHPNTCIRTWFFGAPLLNILLGAGLLCKRSACFKLRLFARQMHGDCFAAREGSPTCAKTCIYGSFLNCFVQLSFPCRSPSDFLLCQCMSGKGLPDTLCGSSVVYNNQGCGSGCPSFLSQCCELGVYSSE